MIKTTTETTATTPNEKCSDLLVGWGTENSNEEENNDHGEEEEGAPMIGNSSPNDVTTTSFGQQVMKWGMERSKSSKDKKEDESGLLTANSTISNDHPYDDNPNDPDPNDSKNDEVDKEKYEASNDHGDDSNPYATTDNNKATTVTSNPTGDNAVAEMEQKQQEQQPTRGLWQRFSMLSVGSSRQQGDNNFVDGNNNSGLLQGDSMEEEVIIMERKEDDKTENAKYDNATTGNKYSDEVKTTQNENIQMKNEIVGFGSQPPQCGEIDQTNKKYGLSGLWHSIQLRRIKARHEFDPFSLTKEELEILKEDIQRNFEDKQSMETSATDSGTNKKIGWKDSIQAAVLAPEAFAAYTDRLVEEDDGADNMGVYNSIPLGGENDIIDDYELRKKPMKSMKMEGDELTWGDVKDIILDPETYVIDEDTLEDVDPLGNYRRILPTKNDDEDDCVKDKGTETNMETEGLRMEVIKLTEKIQQLENELKAKDDECQLWKNKAIECETKWNQLREVENI